MDVDGRFTIPDRELRYAFSRSSGPGGQNVNKVNSRVTLTWSPTQSAVVPGPVLRRFLERFGGRLTGEGELQIVSQRFRDQQRNAEDCRQKLLEMLRLVLTPPKTRHATRPTRGSKERRLAAKKHRSQTKSRRREPLD